MKIYFDITSGFLNKSAIRRQLNNSKSKIEYWYPGCRVLLTETSHLIDSTFHFEADNLPDSAENHMKEWFSKIEKFNE